MMTIGLGTLAGSRIVSRLSGWFGGKWVFVAGMGMLAAGPALLATWRPFLAVVGAFLATLTRPGTAE